MTGAAKKRVGAKEMCMYNFLPGGAVAQVFLWHFPQRVQCPTRIGDSDHNLLSFSRRFCFHSSLLVCFSTFLFLCFFASLLLHCGASLLPCLSAFLFFPAALFFQFLCFSAFCFLLFLVSLCLPARQLLCVPAFQFFGFSLFFCSPHCR